LFVCLFPVELQEFLMHSESWTLIRDLICKYSAPFWRLFQVTFLVTFIDRKVR
jgi:hypothetical protein